jgi:hypothetical protein
MSSGWQTEAFDIKRRARHLQNVDSIRRKDQIKIERPVFSWTKSCRAQSRACSSVN